jgi:hypothetical protein
MASGTGSVGSEDTSGTSPSSLEMDVVANGVDFLNSAIFHLEKSDDPSSLKYAVLHLQAAVEILVKVRLQREGIEHIFEDPYSADANKHAQGDFRSVTLETAFRRLDKVAGIALSREDRKALDNLGKERNKLQHFGSTSNREVVATRAATALEVLSHFIQRYLISDAPQDEADYLQQADELISDAVSNITKAREARFARIASELNEWNGIVIHCPHCMQMAWTFQPFDDASRCRFCSYNWSKVESDDAVEEYLGALFGETRYEAAKGRTGWSVTDCPECEMEALIQVSILSDPDSLATNACFHCGFVTADTLGTCMRCDRTTSDPDFDLCSYCLDDLVNSD